MLFKISRLYTAAELFCPAPHGPFAGKPGYMNLSAHRNPGRPIEMAALQGCGIYGLFLFGKLFYVGSYSGAKADCLSGNVLTRWRLHLTYQTLRSPNICVTAADLARILTYDQCPPFDAITDALGGRETSIVDRRKNHPLIQTTGASCTHRKARFAAQNWSLFEPGNETQMFSSISFVFARLKPEALTKAAPMDRSHRQWIKSKWLTPCENHVIHALKPICNTETKLGQERYALLADFERELLRTAATPFVPYVPAKPSSLEMSPMGDLPIDVEMPELGQEAPTEKSNPLELEAMETGESRFRDRLSHASEAFIYEMDQICPAGIEMGFVNIPELRLFSEPRHAVLIKIKVMSRGRMTGFARTTAAVAKALGFKDAIDEQNWARFSLDTQIHQPSAIIALAGSALAGRV